MLFLRLFADYYIARILKTDIQKCLTNIGYPIII